MLLSLLIGLLPLAASAVDPQCRESADVSIWVSPSVPQVGLPLRVMAVGAEQPLSELAVGTDPDHRMVTSTPVRGGPPWSLDTRIPVTPKGTVRIEAYRNEKVVACREIEIGDPQPHADRPNTQAGLDWDQNTEAFYSAWIERLFDAPPTEALGFSSLQEVLRDRERNFLYDHLRLGEDDNSNRAALPAKPDCADLPYFLRAYFAWKIGLPFGVRSCSRGTSQTPPRCGGPRLTARPGQGADLLGSFKTFARVLVDTVQSGSARTALDDETTDFYPVELARSVLRPGVIYADPYGHTLMIVKWVPQTSEQSGLLLAVDAQPDNSVGRKRFWEGTFLFDSNTPSAGPGFKAFRPIVRDGNGLRPLRNTELTSGQRFLPFSDEQANLSAREFYARIGGLINPHGLDPRRAYEDTLEALVEQLQTRVGSVDNGERYMRSHPTPPVEMPTGARIFETIGPWEDYATPSRDMRLLIAMNVLLDLPQRIVEHPELFVLRGSTAAEARAAVETLHESRIHEQSIEYTRSDGSPWKLTVAEVLARKAAFEMAYNPNDCVEIRWGAPEGTPEYATCRRRAPAAQRVRMQEYREWFRETRRPPR